MAAERWEARAGASVLSLSRACRIAFVTAVRALSEVLLALRVSASAAAHFLGQPVHIQANCSDTIVIAVGSCDFDLLKEFLVAEPVFIESELVGYGSCVAIAAYAKAGIDGSSDAS